MKYNDNGNKVIGVEIIGIFDLKTKQKLTKIV